MIFYHYRLQIYCSIFITVYVIEFPHCRGFFLGRSEKVVVLYKILDEILDEDLRGNNTKMLKHIISLLELFINFQTL